MQKTSMESTPSANTDGVASSNNPTNPTSNSDSNCPRKRGPYKKRAGCWDHFKEFIDGDRNKSGKCIHCGKVLLADARNNGTSSLNYHIKVCEKNTSNSSNQTIMCIGQKEKDGQMVPSLMGWKFDQAHIRKKVANMIIVDELPFKFVEGKGFKELMNSCCPQFNIPSRWTISRDCYEIYLDERRKLKDFIKNSSSTICLTTDTWTSIQRINYMCLTAHFVDNDWKLHKKILNFCPISSHKGNEVGKVIDKCLIDWGIDKVFAITVDNASSNDTTIQFLRTKFVNCGKAIVGGKLLHMRCIAHISNLIVVDGLRQHVNSIDYIRAAVKYVRQSPARLKKFKECAISENIDCKKMLCLDVSTRWNSTFLMLDTAQRFERAFSRFDDEDPYFRIELDCVPTHEDWKIARHLCIFLEAFYELTLKVSGSTYVTSNSLFSDISNVDGILKSMMESNDYGLCTMSKLMKDKFDKYWGNVEKMNMLIFIAPILDPRVKYEFLEFVLKKMYGEDNGKNVAKIAKNSLIELFEEYKRRDCPEEVDSILSLSSSNSSRNTKVLDGDVGKRIQEMYKLEFKRKKLEHGGRESKSELDKYLLEDQEDESDVFDILFWCKVNSPRFPILSKVTRDVLAIPVSTVASESAFSTGGRVLDAFRSSLTPKVVQALVCAQDWLRSSSSKMNMEESLEDLEEFEIGLSKLTSETSAVDI